MSVRRARIIHPLLLIAFLCVPAGKALAQNENETVGFRPNHIFESGQFGENIDILNGGVNLTIPIGQHFQVNSRLGMSLTLAYNSKVWDTSYFRSGAITNASEVVTSAKSPFGLGFTMNLGRIFVDRRYDFGCGTDYYTCNSGDWKWVSPDGSQHEIYTFKDMMIVQPQPGVTIPGTRPPNGAPLDPVFTRRATNDLSYALISGPGDQYCYGNKDDGTQETGCFRVETPDGLVYTLVKRTDCVVTPGTLDGNATFQQQRSDDQAYCGWYTRLIEDTSVGQRTTDASGRTTVPYPNNIQVSYDSRTGFKHALAGVVDSAGRAINFHNCEWIPQDQIPSGTDISEQCQPNSKDASYSTTNPSAVATYAIELPAVGSSTSVLNPAAVATYRFMYRLEKIKVPHSDFEIPINCTVPDCVNGQLMTHNPVLKLVRIDYPPYVRPGQTGTEEYSLYYGTFNSSTDPSVYTGDYGEVTCRTLPVLRKSGGAVRFFGNACYVGGEWALFTYTYNYYMYISAFLSAGTPAGRPCIPGGPGSCDGPPSAPGSGTIQPTGLTRHLMSKSLENPSGSTTGSSAWSYVRYGSSLTNPYEVIVTDPLGNDTVYLYLASTTSPDSSLGPAPQDGYAPEWNDGINYEIDYYQGTGGGRKLLRSELRDYEGDHDTVYRDQLSKSNVRPKRVTTRYYDDGARDQIVTRNNWDGFGHWGLEVESGFDTEPRTTQSEYSDGSHCSVTTTLACHRNGTASICPAGETCVTNPDFYETDLQLMKEVSDGRKVLSRTDSVHTSRGKLVKTLQRAVLPAVIGTPPPTEPATQAGWLSQAQRAGDVLTEFTYSAASGNATGKKLTSGRTGDPTYSINYTYTPALGTCTVAGECGGYLATKVFLTTPGGAPATWKAIDRDRDANTGLILATRDTAGVRTDYSYDAIGRVTQVAPAGEVPTVVDYVSLVETTVTRGTRGSNDLDPAADFVFTRYLYDGLGRQVVTQNRPADPTRGFACQKTQYDILNQVVYRTESKYWAPVGGAPPRDACAALPVPPQNTCAAYGVDRSQDPGAESDYRDPDSSACDPFGRVRLMIPADGDRSTGDKVVRTDYFGTSSRVTVNSVRGTGGASFPSTTAYLKDALGRLLTVDASSGSRCSGSGAICSIDGDCGTGQTCVAADGGADAQYQYDAADRLTEVTLTDNLAQVQTRRFGYDGLGRQLWTENPESGTTITLGYDGLGNPLAIQDAKGNVQKLHYDYAGRPTDHGVVAAGNGTEILVSRNVYDETTAGLYPGGKVTSIFSYDSAGAGVATERRTYSGLGGRISASSTEFTDWGAGTGETTTYAYTSRGELQSIGYPQENPSTHTPLVIDYTYPNGQVVTATEDGIGTLLGRVTYNAAGGVEIVDMPGGGRTIMAYDTRNRPGSVTAGQWNGTSWTRPPDYDSGAYAYDGAGNIYQIGANQYGYDAANRLIAAHTAYGGNAYDESFVYDIYGNIQQHQLTTVTTTSVTETDNFIFGLPTTNQIATRQTMVGSSTASAVPFLYDLNGNLVEGGRRWQPTPTSTVEDVKTFEYDAQNRLLRIQQIGDTANQAAMSEVDAFAYDAGGDRVRKSERGGGAVEYYVRNGSGHVLSEFRSAGPAATREWSADYVYLGDRLLALKETLRPRAVTGLKASQSASPNTGFWRVSITWDSNPESDIQSYKVYRLAQGIETTLTNIGSASSTTFADATDFSPGVLVLYQVSAVKTSSQESASRPQVGLRAGDADVPSAPTLSGMAGDGRVVLTWSASTDPSSDIAGYEVQRRTSTTGTPVALTSPLVMGATFVDPNLVNGITYYYRVRAKDAAGNWGPLSCQPGPLCDLAVTPRDMAPPAMPKGLTASSGCGAAGVPNPVTLVWESAAPGDGVAGYEIHRNAVPQFDDTTLIASVAGTTYDDTASLTPGTTYFYALRAVDSVMPVPNKSAFTPPLGVSPRDSSLTPLVDILARSGDGFVDLQWQGSFGAGTPNPQPSKYLIYRRLDANRSCSAYELIGEAPYAWLGSFTDGSVENNAAYDYAFTAVVGDRESGFSRAGLGVPLARPTNITQCADNDPWPYGGWSTVVSWTPPVATFYQPLEASTTHDTFAFLKGYRLYHHKLCGRPDYDYSASPPRFLDFVDNSAIKIVVPPHNSSNPGDPYDPYLVDTYDGSRPDMADPRYLISSSSAATPLEPLSTYPGVNQNVFGDCGVNNDTNCAMPKAVYKVYAAGTWMTVESDWPDYFDPLQMNPDNICAYNLKNPYDADMPACSNPGANPRFVPPPRRVSATAAGPGAIKIDWVPPAIAAGKPSIAGYYLYASSYFGSNERHSFKAPLPFATTGPSTTTMTLTGLGASYHGYTKFSVATVDEEGHVSGAPGKACALTGTDCSATNSCSLTTCQYSGVTCTTDANCSSYGVCNYVGNQCSAGLPCTRAVCTSSSHPSCTYVGLVGQWKASNGNGATTVSVPLSSTPVPGDALIAFVITRGTTPSRVQSVTQTGVAWTRSTSQAYSGSGVTGEIWYALNVAGAGTTVTFTLASSLPAEAFVAEYSGIIASAALDRTSSQTATSGTSPSTGTTSVTTQGDEVWIGGLGARNQGTLSNPTSGYAAVITGIGSGTTSSSYLTGALYEKYVTATGAAGMSATLSASTAWVGVGATFKSVSQSTCGNRTSCAIQICRPDTCTSSERCTDSIGRWCRSDNSLSCNVATDCPAYSNGHCNFTTTQTCNPTSPACPSGEVCIPGDSCDNFTDSAVALPGPETAQPAPPAALKTILWTVNDHIVGPGRDGIKLGWASAATASTIQGFRVYRSATPDGPYCALVWTGSRNLPLPAGISECPDIPGHQVSQDAVSSDLSSLFVSDTFASQKYWDRTVTADHVYYYRVSQVEGTSTWQETPFTATYQVAGRALGYDPNILPPPQGFRAGASEVASIGDKGSVALRWCSMPASPDLPTVTEYRVYKKIDPQTFFQLFAKVAPSCLAAGNRCEITSTNACVNSQGQYQSCSTIQPTTGCNDSTGPRCGVVDHTFICWPYQNDPPGNQAMYNYQYYVTAVGQLGANPPVESAPSPMNRAWLNYCDTIRPYSDPNWGCPPSSCTWFERRDPDGNTDTGSHDLVCGDENVRLMTPEPLPNRDRIDGLTEVSALAPDLPPIDMAPHRIIGGQPCNEDGGCHGGGGGGGGNPYNPPARWAFYHLDHLGSVRVILDATGVVVTKHNYLPFGEERPVQVEASLNTKAFTGHERDKESGLDYMMARYYSSSLERFVTVDPGEDGGAEDPQKWNRYAYVHNRPVNLNDPTGEYAVLDDLAFAAAGAVIGAVSQGVQDLASGHLSSGKDYASSIAGGAAAGWASEYVGPVAGAAAGGIVKEATSQAIEIHEGTRSGFDGKEIVKEGAKGLVSGIIGKALPAVSAGKGSLASIEKQAVTKLKEGVISSIAPKTAAKIFGAETANGVIGAVADGVTSGAAGPNSEDNSHKDVPQPTNEQMVDRQH